MYKKETAAGTAAHKGKVNGHESTNPGMDGNGYSEQNFTFVDDIAGEVNETNGATKSLADFVSRRITKEKAIPVAPPVFKVGESPVAARKDITAMTAEGKGGKTAFKTAMVSAAISKTGEVPCFKDLHAEPNVNGHAVIDLDTEQSEPDQQYNLKNALKMAGHDKTPDFYWSCNIKTLPLEEYKAFTNELCSRAKTRSSCRWMTSHITSMCQFQTIGADYILSINDEAEATAIVAWFIWLANEYDCPVIVVIHLNENAGKNGDTMPRGWIGRQAVRKGYAQLNITKQADISTLQVLRARKASSTETPVINYQYDKEKGHHVSVDGDVFGVDKQKDKDSAQFKKCVAFAKEVFAPPAALRQTDAVGELMKISKKSKPTAKRMLGDLLLWEVVSKNDDGFYRLIV